MLENKHYKISLYKLDVSRLPGVLTITMKRMDEDSLGNKGPLTFDPGKQKDTRVSI